MIEEDGEQLAAGFRSMHMLAGLVKRGGRPAAVTPTIALRDGEKQFGWFPVRVDGGARRVVAVITNLRLIVGDENVPLWAIIRIRPIAGEWSVSLDVRNRAEPLVLAGPWVLWMSVVICAELYGAAWPPGLASAGAIPEPPGLASVCAVPEPSGLAPVSRAPGRVGRIPKPRGRRHRVVREKCR